ncbi:MAG: OmpA family protein [Kiritimatiellae bacterium]|nr:OmpA family protein [Kiritimatiellia bacterium]
MMRLDGGEVSAGQFEPVYFEYDSPRLNPAEQAKIDAVVACLQQNPSYGVIVEGHCDERGSNEYNLALGERRALAVRAAIVSAGIDGARVQTSSRGEESPSAMGHDESSWGLNRRAEFVFTQM